MLPLVQTCIVVPTLAVVSVRAPVRAMVAPARHLVERIETLGTRTADSSTAVQRETAVVVLLATATGWTVSAFVLELLARSEWPSVLWVPLDRIFLALAVLAAITGFGLQINRSLVKPWDRTDGLAGRNAVIGFGNVSRQRVRADATTLMSITMPTKSAPQNRRQERASCEKV